MSPEPGSVQNDEEEWDEPRRSIFAAWWFRLVLAVVVVAVVVVVALPYFLDWWSPPPPQPTPTVKAPVPPPPPPLETPAQKAIPAPPPQKAEAPKAPPAPAKLQPAPPPSPAKAPQVGAKAAAKPEASAPAPPRQRPSAAATKGEYWIQVGAFKDEVNAERLAKKLADDNLPARHFATARPVGGTHTVVVVGASQSEVNGKLPGKEYRAEAAGDDVVIRPALPLKDAVSLSKELTRAGFTVKIRRASATATFHVVRVGGYPHRQGAEAVQKDLAAKGISGFIVRAKGG